MIVGLLQRGMCGRFHQKYHCLDISSMIYQRLEYASDEAYVIDYTFSWTWYD